MKRVSLEEYRGKLVKTIVTPNGLTVKVKVMVDSLPFLELSRKHGLENPYELEPLDLAKRVRSLQRELFKEYVLSPKIDEELSFNEIFEEDRVAIFQVITEKLAFFRETTNRNLPKPERGNKNFS